MINLANNFNCSLNLQIKRVCSEFGKTKEITEIPLCIKEFNTHIMYEYIKVLLYT